MNEFLIDIGVSVLLRVVKSQRERRKYARALAKVFDAIQKAAATDDVLSTEIALKQESK